MQIENRLVRSEKFTCQPTLIPDQPHLYINDIKRCIDSITQSLVRLEHQVQNFMRCMIKHRQLFDSTDRLYSEAKNGGMIAVHHGELGDPLHEPLEDHNHIGRTTTTLEPSHFPVI